MARIDFPSSPTLNQIYTRADLGKSWRWDGFAWIPRTVGSAVQQLYRGTAVPIVGTPALVDSSIPAVYLQTDASTPTIVLREWHWTGSAWVPVGTRVQESIFLEGNSNGTPTPLIMSSTAGKIIEVTPVAQVGPVGGTDILTLSANGVSTGITATLAAGATYAASTVPGTPVTLAAASRLTFTRTGGTSSTPAQNASLIITGVF